MINIFISGASSGLGLSMYRALILKNVFITVLSRTVPKNLRAKDKYLFTDFSRKINIKYKPNKRISKVIFLSNAGIIEPIGPADKIDEKQLRRNNNINFFSPFIIASELTRGTKSQKIPLHIINISSGAANKPIAGWAAYCSSKSAIKIALECIAAENKHVTVEHVNPGVLDTNMQHKIRSSEIKIIPERQYFTNLYKKGLLKKPESAANVIINKIEKYIK